jgi:hypothetical protein
MAFDDEHGAVSSELPWRDNVAAVLGSVIELIQDPHDTWHKAGEPGACLRVLVDDLAAVAAWLADTGQTPPNPGLVAQFLTWAKPRRLAGKTVHDTVGYVRPAWRATARDDTLLALAAVRTFAQWTDPARRTSAIWAIYRDGIAVVWPTPTEARELDQMAAVLDTAFAARYTRRRRPASRPTANKPAR